ncbi:MAG: hypothetical protein M0Z71_11925 [Nitrospiraceae bacterium]|nr:hypothetical protein [Nitrospiraceae bacterium]
MAKKRNEKDIPLVSMGRNEREDVWDDIYQKEEGVVTDFDPESDTGKIKSLHDGTVYSIDSRELNRIRIELRTGDQVLFAPIEDPAGENFARVIRIIQLNAL